MGQVFGQLLVEVKGRALQALALVGRQPAAGGDQCLSGDDAGARKEIGDPIERQLSSGEAAGAEELGVGLGWQPQVGPQALPSTSSTGH